MEFTRTQGVSVSADLLTEVAKGNANAFERLYDATCGLLLALVMRILNDRDEASEVLQEVYLEAWRKASTYDSQRGSPVAWLITLTRSRAIDRRRSAGSRMRDVTASIDETHADALPSQTPNPFEVRADGELREWVVNAFEELPLAQQQAVELAYFEGLTHTEIAARLNEPVGTIKTRIKLGMSKLKNALRPCWETK